MKSVLGRFLEHSRIFHFVNAGNDEYWIGSADLMGRNLDRRVESLVRIDKKDHQHRLQEIIDLGLSPESASWQLTGTEWEKVSTNSRGEALLDVHAAFIHLYSKDR